VVVAVDGDGERETVVDGEDDVGGDDDWVDKAVTVIAGEPTASGTRLPSLVDCSSASKDSVSGIAGAVAMV
jgi:hypothetical protein